MTTEQLIAIIIFTLDVICTTAVLFVEKKNPNEALMWAILIMVIPLLGVILYLFLGSTFKTKLKYRRNCKKLEELKRQGIYENIRQITLLGKNPDELNEVNYENIRFNLAYNESPLLTCETAEIITDGKTKYDRLFEDINSAKHSVHIEYYAIHKDSVGERLVTLLTDKAAEGVTVRLMYDRQGSSGSKKLFKPLKKAGGQVYPLKKYFTHFRNHRKIVVIDGEVAYTGGMNIGEKYLGFNNKKSPWRDTQVRVTGSTVSFLQYIFIYDWFFVHRKNKSGITAKNAYELFKNTENTSPNCQVVGSGIESDRKHIEMTYLRLISSAKKRIVIQSPYFVPTEPILEAIEVAAASGVEVVLMLPQRKSSFFLQPVTNYYINEVLPYGVKVFLYEGYIHAKTVTVDGDVTVIGSVNMDVRSFRLDDEVCMLFYDKGIIADHQKVLEEDFKNSNELNYAKFKKRGLWRRFKERVFLIFSPLM